jgi:PAS domain S-box-containing protein
MIADRRDLESVEHAVARILAQTEHPVEVYEAALEAIGRRLGWELGAVWEVDRQSGTLHCIRTWYTAAGAEVREFVAFSERLTFAPGEGLPGRVLESGEAAWIFDAPQDGNFPRAEAAQRAGLHAAFCFPLRSAGGCIGMIEFFSHERREPDPEVLATMDLLGSLIGQFVARRHAEEEVRGNESRLRAMLEAALDAVVTMDHQGNVIGWNHAATAIFGYHPNEVIGREMADLIVPPHLRRAHRQGLARLLEGQQPKILDRRLELTGMRRDGTEFPVELTITRINLPGQPTFTGYLRDITERVRAEQELRASRVRLLEVADEERKRIQRNLHDGAQQRITAVLLNLGRLREKPEERQELLGAAIDELVTGLEEIRALASGLHPAVLAERGLVPALRALVLAAPIEVELATLPEERLPEPVEAAAYYVVAEALANVQKHAGATRVVVHASTDEHRLVVEVADDGIGGADDAGSGLRGLTDRVEALGGRLSLDSPPGGGTRLLAEIPVS